VDRETDTVYTKSVVSLLCEERLKWFLTMPEIIIESLVLLGKILPIMYMEFLLC
jgi:hypothetical protein